MILVDKEIQKSVAENQLIENFDPENFTNIGYDLVADIFTVAKDAEQTNVTLEPGESTFVRSKEKVKLPVQLAARVVLRNSRIRQGLSLEAPLYQPGHETHVFFRITNVSQRAITLEQGDKIATIVFEELHDVPDHPYSGGFQEEVNYRGMGVYEAKYSKQMKDIEKKMQDLKDIEKSLYGNVMTLMTVFIGIFSLVNINLTAVTVQTVGMLQLLSYNLAIIGGVSVLSGLIRVLVPDLGKKKLPLLYWLIPVLSFAVSILLAFFL